MVDSPDEDIGGPAFEDINLEHMQARLIRKQRLEALGQLAGGMAHDFNNVLGVISNTAQLISVVANDPERSAELAKRIATAAMRGADMTRRLLAFYRLDPRPCLIEPHAALAEIRELLRHALQRHVQVEVSIEPGTWPVWCDAGELQLALLNLALNSRDAMPDGGRLRLSARKRTVNTAVAQGEYVEMSVADTGCGMSEATRSRALEPFFTTKSKDEGVGLGLTQVCGFARHSRGTIELDSHPGEGTTARLLLPRAVAEP